MKVTPQKTAALRRKSRTKIKWDVPMKFCMKIDEKNFVLRGVADTCEMFCKETTLHGVRYIVGKKNPDGYNRRLKQITILISRLVWMTACVSGAIFAIAMMSLVWDRFQTTPTVTTIETTSHPVWDVPFPSVTLCNINKVYRPNTLNITRILLENGIEIDTVQEFLENLSNLISPENVDSIYIKTYTILEKFGYNTEKLMMELVQPCENMLKLCFWLGNEVPCHGIFKLSKSSEGLCCSFNYRALKSFLEIDPESNDTMGNNEVLHVSGSGRNVGLHIVVDIEPESSVAMTRNYYGIEVMVHDAEEFPQSSVTTAVAQPGQEVVIAVKPSVVSSRPSVRGVAVKKRNCYFNDEYKLRATKKYTLNSCIAECRVDTIVKKCKCLPFFFPDISTFANEYRQCDLHDVDCLRNYRSIFESLQPPLNTPGFNTTIDIGIDCPCLPSCSEQNYQISVTTASRTHTGIKEPLYGNADLTNLTSILVYFKELTCIEYRRDLYMSWDGLLASFGGIFGLCLGGSVLSLVEMLYYFTIKLCINVISCKRKADSAARITLGGANPWAIPQSRKHNHIPDTHYRARRQIVW
ncbi:sodium channel protein Nach [Sergentomyia squamirostris]